MPWFVAVFTLLVTSMWGLVVGGLGAVIATYLEYRRPTWGPWKRLLTFALPIGTVVGIAGAMFQLSRATVFESPLEGFVFGVCAGVFMGGALYLSLPAERQQNWWDQLRPGLLTGVISGLLLAAVFFFDNLFRGGDLSHVQQALLWVEYPIYMTTITTTFALGIEVGNRLLLGPPGSSRI
jgi:hypothetical protein